jgi:hypothetical protein
MAYTYTVTVSIPEEVETEIDFITWIHGEMETEDFKAISAWLSLDQFDTTDTWEREIVENTMVTTRVSDTEAQAIQNMEELKALFKSDTVVPTYSDITEV